MGPEILILFAVLIGFMFFSTRKARKQQQEKSAFQAELAPGQEVLTASGLLGTVVAVDGDIVTLEHVPGTQTTWVRAAIARAYEPPAVYEDDDVESAATTIEGDEDGSTPPGMIDKP